MSSLVLAAAVVCTASADMDIGRYSQQVKDRVVSRVAEALAEGGTATVSGVVTFAGEGFFFIQRADDGLKVIAEPPVRMPRTGECVSVVGAPSLEGGRVVFRAKEWSRNGAAELPRPRMVSMDDLVYAGGEKKSVHALRVVLAGRAIGLTDNGFAVDVEGVPVNVMIDRPPEFLSGCERTHPKLTLRGVAELLLDQSALMGRASYVMGVKLNVSSEEDVTLVPDLSYLAACHDRRVMWGAAALIAVLAVGIVLFVFVVVRQQRRLLRDRAIMDERRRMADDIHDTIEQHLVGAKMLLQLNRLKEAQDVIVRAKREIRDIVWGLKNDDMMRQTPTEMIRQLAHDETTKGICRVDTRLSGLPAHLDAAAMRDLSLIVREAIGNAVKHGGAKKIAISSDPGEDGGWMLRIANDGTPFEPEKAQGVEEGHFGIAGMRQRARRLNAEISFARRKEGMVLILEKKS